MVNAVFNVLTLATVPVQQKSNEITTYPIILKALHEIGLVMKKVFTIDAMMVRQKP
jgi:hypothetical protein